MDKKYVLLVLFLLGITMLIPVNYSFAAIKETTLTLDPVHKYYRVGEDIIFTGKLVDSEKYMLLNEEIKIMPSSTLSRTIGTDLTDARGNFRIVVPAELWNGDGGNVSFIAYYYGSDKFTESKSNVIISEMRKLYTPLGKEFEYENLQKEGYFNQKSAPDKAVVSQKEIPTQTSTNVPITKSCPAGTYHGVDNQNNEVCKDLSTNQILSIVEKNTKTDSNVLQKNTIQQNSCADPFSSECIRIPSLSSKEIFLAIIVILIILLIIIVGRVIGKKRKIAQYANMKKQDYRYGGNDNSRIFSNSDRLMWTCSICHQKFTDRSSYLSHGCHFR